MKKSNLSAKNKEKWEMVLKSELMSSEESGEDDTIIVKPLLWRAAKLNRFFHSLDEANNEVKTPQAKRQKRRRVFSEEASVREKPNPDSNSIPEWAFS